MLLQYKDDILSVKGFPYSQLSYSHNGNPCAWKALFILEMAPGIPWYADMCDTDTWYIFTGELYFYWRVVCTMVDELRFNLTNPLTHLLLDKMAAILADNIFKCLSLN